MDLNRYLMLWSGLLLGLSRPAQATEPTLARLSFWVPPGRMAGFEAAYQEQLAPLLKQHGLVESPERGRATVDSVFSRLFALDSAAQIAAAGQGLQQDSLWQEALQSTGAGQWHWGVYAVPAGSGKTVEAGSGFRQGLWQSFGPQDGLPSSAPIRGILQDRAGNLWFSVVGVGVTRYDGAHFTTFTTADGLASDSVGTMAEDQEGNLWLPTLDGVSRYDGTHFTTFTRADGLAGNHAIAVLMDRDGHLWFAFVDGGVSRYDRHGFKTWTAKDGLAGNEVTSIIQDRQGNLWFGTWGSGVSRYDGTRFRTFTPADGLAGNQVLSMAEDRQGRLWFGTVDGVSWYDGARFTDFIPEDSWTTRSITAILQDHQGDMWFSSGMEGVSRYDGQRLITSTVEDGLVNNQVLSMLEDRDGHLWFGCENGVSRYDGAQFTLFTAKNGLANNGVMSLLEDRRGMLWVGTWVGVSRYDGKEMAVVTDLGTRSMIEDRLGNLWFAGYGGVRWYDGKTFTTVTQKDGLAPFDVWSVAEDREGELWFGGRFADENISRYDGRRFTTVGKKDSLSTLWVLDILEDRKGELWFATREGLRHYDGQRFTSFTGEDGLAGDEASCLLEDRQGYLWIGTTDGVSRYDGKEFANFTTAEGLAGNQVISMLEDRDGHLWFGTFGSGLSQYDGLVFQSLSRKDGLPNDAVQEILQDRKRNIWIGTEGGLVRYRPSRTPPAIRLVNVSADRRYGPVAQLQLSALQDYLLFEFQGASLATPPECMAYVYRLVGYEDEWRPSYVNRVEYVDLPLGEYVFEVKAVDQDLNYSEIPATVKVTIHPPYGQLALGGGLAIALIGLAFASGTAIRRRHAFLREQQSRLRTQEQLNKELEGELQKAHNLQMGLMPTEPPRIAGYEFAGRCFTANHVGGDIFKYYPLPQGQMLGVLADVTGHAMDAAVPLLIFCGILETQMELGGSLEQLFARLNRSLHRTLPNHTFVCLAMGALDPATRTLRLANAGCPYPYHYWAATGQVVEVQLDAYPLGVRPDTTYQTIEVQLAPGDRVVFCSDGIIEAANAAGEMFGFERTGETIRKGCAEDLSAGALLARIIQEVKTFSGEAPQGDDQTVVVLKVDDRRSA